MSNHPFAEQRSLFKAYDVRGDNALFTEAFIRAFAQAFARQLAKSQVRRLVIGYDMRQASQTIAQQLAFAIADCGIEVIWLGLVSTPMMAFWANEYDGHGVIATASHSERHICGIKWLLFGESPGSEDIIHLYDSLLTVPPSASLDQPVTQLPVTYLDQKSVHQRYLMQAVKAIHAIKDHVASTVPCRGVFADSDSDKADEASTHSPAMTSPTVLNPIKPFKVVIDCLNGATGPIAHAFFAQFETLCHEVIVLNEVPDGDFPFGNPDPTEPGRLESLKVAVLAHQADIGLGFDGDGDRLMVVDNRGKILAPDHLLYLLAKVAIEDSIPAQSRSASDSSTRSGRATPYKKEDGQANFAKATCPPTVIFDVKCSHHLPALIEQMGAQPYMSKTGSSIMRKALQSGSSQALFAGELSGHFLFNDGYFVLHDDAMYAALRLIYWLSRRPDSLADIVAKLPAMINTPDVYLPLKSHDYTSSVDERPLLAKLAKLCQRLQSGCSSDSNPAFFSQGRLLPLTGSRKLGLPANTRLTCIDGIRLDFTNGFGVIRPSNTSHCLTVRFAGNTLADLRAIQQRFVALCEYIDTDLAGQIAKIRPSS
ncbi:MAG: phosphomannomutase/phosphoglucomutase [Psychrobacter sp.]|nr:phosphomannomutase/phosphoglucomutase [Psychrobacter sp.]